MEIVLLTQIFYKKNDFLKLCSAELQIITFNVAQKAVKKGDLMGWGILFPDDTTHQDEEQLVICYLTINRSVALTRVLYQPPGGFCPVVLMPPGGRFHINLFSPHIVSSVHFSLFKIYRACVAHLIKQY